MATAETPRAGAERLQCVVVTPERTLIDEAADFVALPLFDGELGVLPGRLPLIGRLGFGELRTRVEDRTSRYFIDGGFVQVRDDVITVLTPRAVPAQEIRTHSVHEELNQALAIRADSDAAQAAKDRALARARARLRVAEGRA